MHRLINEHQDSLETGFFFFFYHPEFLAPSLLQGLSDFCCKYISVRILFKPVSVSLKPYEAMLMKSTDIYNINWKKNRYHIAITAEEVHFWVAIICRGTERYGCINSLIKCWNCTKQGCTMKQCCTENIQCGFSCLDETHLTFVLHWVLKQLPSSKKSKQVKSNAEDTKSMNILFKKERKLFLCFKSLYGW